MTAIRLGLVAAALTAGLATVPAFAQAANRCAVTDPTGTPLNIRETPNGEIIGRVTNGAGVRVVNTSFDERGRPWVLIRPRGAGVLEAARSGTSQVVGWVYREFVSCY